MRSSPCLIYQPIESRRHNLIPCLHRSGSLSSCGSGASPSPDGNFIVFERKLGNVSSLWVMERANPVNMWSLTTGSKPDWSRVNPSVSAPPTNTPTPPPGNQNHRIYLPAVQS